MRKILRHIYLQVAGIFFRAKPGIHIINSHYITPNLLNQNTDYETFENYLQYLNKIGTFINLDAATKLINQNNIPKNEVLIAFTFDDGFEECYTIIAPLLEKYNCRGAFFINANYIDSSPEYQENFNKRILTYTKKPMSWKQVIDLHKRGHLIGSHNLDHRNMTELNEVELHFQLTENKRILEMKLNYTCDYFAWTYGRMEHFSLAALEQSMKIHKYIFSGTNYKEYFSFKGKVINRRHLEPFWPKKHISYFLSVNKKVI